MSSPESPLAALRSWLEVNFLRRSALVLGLVITAVYAGMAAEELAFDNAFILKDDTRLRVFSFESIQLIYQHDYWWGSMASNLYRPLSTFLFWLEYSFLGYGDAPLGYQVANVVIHWGNAVLLAVLARRLGLAAPAAFGAALVYALHPVGTEAVANIVGRSDLLATTGMLGGLWLYFDALDISDERARRRRLWLMGACGMVAMMAKESAIVLPAIVAWHGLLRLGEWSEGGEARRRWLADAGVAALALLPMALFFVITRWIFSSAAGVTDHPFIDNPLVNEGFLVSRLSAFGVWGLQLWALFLPLDLSNDYSFNAIPVAVLPFGNATALWGWATMLAFGAAGWAVWRARLRWPAGIFLLGAYVIGMLPTSNLIIRIGSIRADRFHYLPSGLLWALIFGAVALGWAKWRQTPRAGLLRLALVPVLAWTLCLGLLAHFRCYDWRSNLALWSSALVAQPGSAKVLAASGNARVIANQNPETEEAALRGLLAAVQMFKTNDVPMHYWPMQTYSDLIASYLSLYDSALARGESGPEVEGFLDQAFKVHEEAMVVEAVVQKRWLDIFGDEQTETAPFLDTLHRNYAVILSRRGRDEEAKKALMKVLDLLPLKAQNYTVMADINNAGGFYAEALSDYIFVRIMEPGTTGDLSKIANAAKKVDPDSKPLIDDGAGSLKLNLNDPLIERETRRSLLRYQRVLLKSGLTLDALRVERVAKYFYGIREPMSTWRE